MAKAGEAAGVHAEQPMALELRKMVKGTGKNRSEMTEHLTELLCSKLSILIQYIGIISLH